MKFTVAAPVPVTAKPDSFEVAITAMFGDADGYHTFTVKPFYRGQDEDALESLLSTLKRMKEAYPYGRGGGDGYIDVEGFLSWFGTSEIEDEASYETVYQGAYFTTEVPYPAFKEHQEFAERIAAAAGDEYPAHAEWPSDPAGDGDDAGYDTVEIFYYDENLAKHTVTVSE